MSTKPNMKAEELKQALLRENNINVFDVFALLYLYCDPRFNTICPKLKDIDTFRQVSLDARKLQDSILPSGRNALAPIDPKRRTLLASSLRPNSNQSNFDLQCFTLLDAIDSTYDNISARSTNLANFPTIPQHLNLNTEIALVYAKKLSPVYRLVQKVITRSSRKGEKCSKLRTGRERGDHLRDYVHNLACVSLPSGYDIDFSGLDSSVRLCFPDNLDNCRIALVPLVDQISQMKIQFFNLDSQNKRPFLITGLTETARIARQTLAILEQLSERGVTLVIFPELSVPEEVRRAISQGLKQSLFPSIKMVIAGSCHEQVGDEWYNTAYVLGPDGQVLWQQHKLQPCTLMSYEAKRLSSFANFADYDLYERISTAPRVIVVRDTPMGRMALLICSDLLHTDPHRELLFDAGANCIVVPIMSAVLEPDFTIAAEQFAIHSQATILVSNACAVAREAASYDGATGAKVSFAFLPAYPSIRWFHCDIPAGQCPNRQCCEDFIIQLGSWPSNFE